ncbi:7093_t:CDS:2 [Gigaspora margarita]|uniref:7093_t:CDS:1 n=1 Tax=Gigaspora margarita TaxID=4874 RepID=A0ABN7UHT7_GIGMA|nr:7093_t:CDS:2 [Gigaspora margarita]
MSSRTPSSWDDHSLELLRAGSRKIVLKTLANSSNLNEEFFKEAFSNFKLAAKVPSLVTCYGITKDSHSGNYMLVLEYMNGGDLNNYLKKHGATLTWLKRYDLLRHISLALSYIHRSDLLHKDLHPGNILFTSIFGSESCCISDLGLSGPAGKNSAGEIYGILPYIAPKVQFDGNYTSAADIYSFGTIMWQLTSRNVPFSDREYDIELSREICYNGLRPQIIPGTPDSYKDMINRCWDADPLKRPDVYELSDFFIEGQKRIRNGDDIFPELNLEKNIAPSSDKTTSKSLASLSDHNNTTDSDQLALSDSNGLLIIKHVEINDSQASKYNNFSSNASSENSFQQSSVVTVNTCSY